MKAKTTFILAIAFVILNVSVSVVAETMKFNGSATTASNQVEMPLANGGVAVTYNATGVAAMTGDSAPNPLLMSIRCNGLGFAAPGADGEIEFYCTFIENEEDRFDVKGTEKAGETQITLIGGSGRWTGSTGNGTLKRTAKSVNSSTSTFELMITTP